MIRGSSSSHPTSHFWMILVPLLAVGIVRGQAHALQPQSDAFNDLVRRLRAELGDPRYSGLDQQQQNAVGGLAISAIEIILSGDCADPTAVDKAAMDVRYRYARVGRDAALKPIFGLPDSRKKLLIDDAMELAAQEESNSELARATCRGKLLPASSVNPIEARRGGARHVLSIALGLERADRPLPRAP